MRFDSIIALYHQTKTLIGFFYFFLFFFMHIGFDHRSFIKRNWDGEDGQIKHHSIIYHILKEIGILYSLF